MSAISYLERDLAAAMVTPLYNPRLDVLTIANTAPRLMTNAKIALGFLETNAIKPLEDAHTHDRWSIKPNRNPADNVICSTTEDYCTCRQHHLAPTVNGDPRGRFCPYRMAALMQVKEASINAQRLAEAIEFVVATLKPKARVVLFIRRAYLDGEDRKTWFGIGVNRFDYIPVDELDLTNASIAEAAARSHLALTTPEHQRGTFTYHYDLRLNAPPEPRSILLAHTSIFIGDQAERQRHTEMLNTNLDRTLRTYDQGERHATP